MITAGVDLAAQAPSTGMVVIDWSTSPPTVSRAARPVTDDQIVDVVREVAGGGGRVGVDCPLGWPRRFREFISSHAEGAVSEEFTRDTSDLRLRATDLVVRAGTGARPLSVSTDKLGATALRAARLLAALDREGLRVDRSGSGTVCEVYPAASLKVWIEATTERAPDDLLRAVPLDAPPHVRAALENEHVFDSLVAALTARAVACGATTRPAADQLELAREEGWIHIPVRGHELNDLVARS